MKRPVTILGATSLALLLGAALPGQESSGRSAQGAAAPPAGTREVGSGRPPVPAPDRRPLPGLTRLGPRGPAPAPVAALAGVRAITMAEGEARLLIDGGERVVRPGDTVGADVVKSISPGRMVLSRQVGTASEATVIVTFGAGGEGHPLVLWSNNPTPHVPPVAP